MQYKASSILCFSLLMTTFLTPSVWGKPGKELMVEGSSSRQSYRESLLYVGDKAPSKNAGTLLVRKAASTENCKKRAETYLKAAEAFYKEKNYAQADTLYLAALYTGQPYYNAVHGGLSDQKMKDAHKKMRKCSENLPLKDKGKFQELLAALTPVSATAPDDLSNNHIIRKYNEMLNEADGFEGQREYSRALGIYLNKIIPHLFVHFDEGENNPAITDYFIRCYASMGRCYYLLEEYESSIKNFWRARILGDSVRRYSKLGPNSFFYLGQSLLALGRLFEAEEAYHATVMPTLFTHSVPESVQVPSVQAHYMLSVLQEIQFKKDGTEGYDLESRENFKLVQAEAPEQIGEFESLIPKSILLERAAQRALPAPQNRSEKKKEKQAVREADPLTTAQKVTAIQNFIHGTENPEEIENHCAKLFDLLKDENLSKGDRTKIVTTIAAAKVKTAEEYMKQRKPDYKNAKKALDPIFREEGLKEGREKALPTYGKVCNHIAKNYVKAKNYGAVVEMLEVFMDSKSKDKNIVECQKLYRQAQGKMPASSKKKGKDTEKASRGKGGAASSPRDKGKGLDLPANNDESGISGSSSSDDEASAGSSAGSSNGSSSSSGGLGNLGNRLKQFVGKAQNFAGHAKDAVEETTQQYMYRRAQELLEFREKGARQRLKTHEVRLLQVPDSSERGQLTRTNSKRNLSVRSFEVSFEDKKLEKKLKGLEDETNTSAQAIYWRKLKAHLEATPNETTEGFNIHTLTNGIHSADWNVGAGQKKGRGALRLFFQVKGGNAEKGEPGKVIILRIGDPHSG